MIGASGGIGRAVALAFAREGADVALAGRDAGTLEHLADNCRDENVSVVTSAFDITDESACLDAVEAVTRRLGAPNVLVNAAGVADTRQFSDITVDLWRSVMRVHVEGPLVLMRAVIPPMVSTGGGAIVNVGSAASVVGLPYAAPYTAAKHALLGLTRSAAAEYADRGITVNCVCPYYVDTPMTQRAIAERMQAKGCDYEEAIRPLLNPQRRLTSAEEVAAACVLLASPGGAAINGQALHVNGGKVQG
ncbi:SDR family NAD(P)-dependent oxidoreductase [Frankia sp. R43]|uniref:SDR family NAD(P)-dependent oxidoreductase n=1 Tax=Frankia sp. R43 TaxID=269536 RepID=UPI0006CA20D8|nr:SDR family NAD(P)-dependent oxidoreductase [Frankia sp. R43]